MKSCSKCKRELPESSFNKANWIKSGLRSDCKECYAKTKRDYWERKGADSPNASRCRALKAEAKMGVKTCRTCGITKPLNEDTFPKSGPWWNSCCRECGREQTRKWAAENPDRYKASAYASCATRYASKKHRTPQWLSREQRQAIVDVYAESRRRRLSGENVHVDHIVPLVGRIVSGLHVPWNLQIIDASLNCQKSNKWAA